MSQLSHEYPDDPAMWAPVRHPADWYFPDEFVRALRDEAAVEDAADEAANEQADKDADERG